MTHRNTHIYTRTSSSSPIIWSWPVCLCPCNLTNSPVDCITSPMVCSCSSKNTLLSAELSTKPTFLSFPSPGVEGIQTSTFHYYCSVIIMVCSSERPDSLLRSFALNRIIIRKKLSAILTLTFIYESLNPQLYACMYLNVVTISILHIKI